MKNKVTLEQLMQEISNYYHAEIQKFEQGQCTYINGLEVRVGLDSRESGEQALRRLFESFEQESYDNAKAMAKQRHFFTRHFWVDASNALPFAQSLFISTPKERESIQQVHAILFSKGKYVAQTVLGRWYDINSTDPSQAFTLGLPMSDVYFARNKGIQVATFQHQEIDKWNPST